MHRSRRKSQFLSARDRDLECLVCRDFRYLPNDSDMRLTFGRTLCTLHLETRGKDAEECCVSKLRSTEAPLRFGDSASVSRL